MLISHTLFETSRVRQLRTRRAGRGEQADSVDYVRAFACRFNDGKEQQCSSVSGIILCSIHSPFTWLKEI